MSIPILIATLFLFMQNRNLEELEELFIGASRKAKTAFERKQKKERFLGRYLYANPYFLNEQIESIVFLQREKQQIQALFSHPASVDKDLLQERLAFLSGNENRFSFIEENIRFSKEMKETEEKQRYPVQMDEDDLKKVLSIIENIPIGLHTPISSSPQLLIRELRMKRLQTPLQTEVFEVEMELHKREFTKS
ncbi:MAG TPA: hypothetical protein VJK48_04885 [Chlamydiales bacterium]|nr:hypothetical protein [Chlamydiales bacterium]